MTIFIETNKQQINYIWEILRYYDFFNIHNNVIITHTDNNNIPHTNNNITHVCIMIIIIIRHCLRPCCLFSLRC